MDRPIRLGRPRPSTGVPLAMILARILLFALTGALGGATVAGLYQALGLVAAGADLGAVRLAPLLLEVMRLTDHALFGAGVGALFAPFAPPIDKAVVGALRWFGFALGGVLALPLVHLTVAAGRLPGFSDLLRDYHLGGAQLAAALGMALLCATTELVYTRARARRYLRQRGIHAGDNDVDETLKAFWRERAENYLAGRNRDPGAPGGGS